MTAIGRADRPWWMAGLLAVLLCALAIARPVDHDESQYVAAAMLSGAGLIPYRDYAYLQTPLQPLLFAPIAWASGRWVWPVLRLVNALLGLAAIAGVYHAARLWGADRRAAHWAAGLFATCDILLFAVGTARNDALPAALLAWALVGVARGERGDASRGTAILTGLVLAAAAAAKISYALPAVAYGLWALAHRGHRPGWVVAGTLPVIVLIAALYAAAPEGFLFGVLHFPSQAPAEYYAARPWKLSWAAKLIDSLKFLTLGPALIGVVLVMRKRPPAVLVLLMIGGAIGAVLPFPTWRQYWLPLLPPLFVALALLWHVAPPAPRWRGALAFFAMVGLVPTLITLIGRDEAMSLPAALGEGQRVAATMDRIGVTGPVATLAPQMLAVTGRMPHPDFATGPFYFRSRALLDAGAERRLHLVAQTRPRIAADWVLVGGEGPWSAGDARLDATLAAAAGGQAVAISGTRFRLIRVAH
ncbi:DUF2029 domain-containing protein [Sphingomonas pseudosanguinis]|uniref:DUF2029 domain-containing protein n=1 Tax=Sphingomonas pseudosanguinis TaxID=413712 RepID=UPI003F855DA5